MSDQMTQRELEILRMIANGQRADKIACVCGISITTVRDHLKRARAKFNATSSAQLIYIAMQRGWIT